MQAVNGEFAIVSSVKTYVLEIVFEGQVVQHPGGDAPKSGPFSRPGGLALRVASAAREVAHPLARRSPKIRLVSYFQ